MTKSQLPYVTENPTLLFLDPGLPVRPEHAIQLGSSPFNIVIAREATDIYLMSGALHFAFAVLSDRVGPVALRAAAQAVRQQWPKAYIIILGRAPTAFEDHLYDESAVHVSDVSALIAKLNRVAEDPWMQRLSDRPILSGL